MWKTAFNKKDEVIWSVWTNHISNFLEGCLSKILLFHSCMLCFNSHHVDHECPTAPCHIDFKALEYLTKADREIWLNPLSASVSLVWGPYGGGAGAWRVKCCSGGMRCVVGGFGMPGWICGSGLQFWDSEAIKQNWTGLEIFDVCFIVIFF